MGLSPTEDGIDRAALRWGEENEGVRVVWAPTRSACVAYKIMRYNFNGPRFIAHAEAPRIPMGVRAQMWRIGQSPAARTPRLREKLRAVAHVRRLLARTMARPEAAKSLEGELAKACRALVRAYRPRKPAEARGSPRKPA